MNQTNFVFRPIAHFQTSKKRTLEAGCQGILDQNSTGVIDLSGFAAWREMLADIDGFSHLWIVFAFHQTQDRWKPKVLPPRSDKKVGVFASRSPYRPNPIGISAVQLIKQEESKLFVAGHDLIDQTPVLDIKPYLRYADSFPEAKDGWLTEQQEYNIHFTKVADAQIEFLMQFNLNEFRSTILQQLRFHPTDKRRKRVKPVIGSDTRSDVHNNFYLFSYGTWRVLFEIQGQTIMVKHIESGYSPQDLAQTDDPYNDKNIHREFVKLVRVQGDATDL